MAPGPRARTSPGAGARPARAPRDRSSSPASSADAALYLPLAIVLVALIVVYLPLRDAQFVQWDDFKTIAGNPDLNPPSASRILRYWDPGRPHMDLYVPVTYTAWAAVASVSTPPATRPGAPRARTPRLDPADFHTASLAVHVIATIFAFLILRRLLAAHGVRGERAAWAAGIGVGLFALHPLQVESVAWASGLKDLLGGAFTLAALWLYLRYVATRETGASLPTGAVDLALATLGFVLAMLSKPSAVVTPLLAGCLLLVLPRRPAPEDSNATASAPDDGASPGRRTLPARLAGLSPLLAPLALWCVLALPVMLIARSAQPAASGFASPLWGRPLVALDALAFYAVKLVAPVRLALDYGR